MAPVSEAEVTMLTFPHSPYTKRVRVALEEKGISYNPIDVDLSNKPKLLLESNPIYKKIPTIIHNGKPVAESLIILEYLDDEWPQQVPLLPKDAFEKSKVRFWADFLYKKWEKFSDPIGSKLGFGSVEMQTAQQELTNVLKSIETAMTGYSTEGPWFTGETFGFLDIVLVPLEHSLQLAEKIGGVVIPGPGEIPRIHKWMEAMSSRPSYRKVMPSNDDTVAFFKVFFERRAAAAAAAAASK